MGEGERAQLWDCREHKQGSHKEMSTLVDQRGLGRGQQSGAPAETGSGVESGLLKLDGVWLK